MTEEEEGDIWQRRFYAKESFTNDDDWEIHEQGGDSMDFLLEFWLENSSRFHFDSVTCLNYQFF